MSSITNAPPRESSEQESLPELKSFATWRMFGLALVAAAAVFLIILGLDALVIHGHETRRVAFEISDAVGGVIAGALIFRLLQYERERRVRLRQKIHRHRRHEP